MVEIARSFSFKLNAGNYESRDFFCSQKVEVQESEAEEASQRLYEFCRMEVMKSVDEFRKQTFNALKPVATPSKEKLAEAVDDFEIGEFGG